MILSLVCVCVNVYGIHFNVMQRKVLSFAVFSTRLFKWTLSVRNNHILEDSKKGLWRPCQFTLNSFYSNVPMMQYHYFIKTKTNWKTPDKVLFLDII